MAERTSVPQEGPGHAGAAGDQARAADTSASEDLIRKITDRVYKMLLDDLAIERERQRPPSRRGISHRGGW